MKIHEAIVYRKSLINKAIEGRKLAENEREWLASNPIYNDSLGYPETKSQGLFHQIHKEVTFCGLPHGADA